MSKIKIKYDRYATKNTHPKAESCRQMSGIVQEMIRERPQITKEELEKVENLSEEFQNLLISYKKYKRLPQNSIFAKRIKQIIENIDKKSIKDEQQIKVLNTLEENSNKIIESESSVFQLNARKNSLFS